MSTNEKLHDHIVAFIDILGSTELIKIDAEKSLEIMHNAYTESIKLFDELFEDKKVKPSVKIFSDNIIVAMPRRGESGHGAFCAIVMLSAIIQVQFLRHGLLTRGGIATGSFFLDDVMVWGKALIKAYELENSTAIYPRVIIDPELIAELGLAQENCMFRSKEWIIQDTDGLFVVDYINKYLGNREIFSLLMMQVIDKKVIQYVNKVKICQKWLWLNNYIKNKIISMTEEK